MRKWLSALVCISIIMQMTVVTFASTSTVASVNSNSEVIQGNVISMTVDLVENPGLAAWVFEVSWDEEALHLDIDSIKVGAPFENGTMLYNQNANGRLVVTWYNIKNVSSDGTLFHLNLIADSNAKPGKYNISLNCSEQNTINIDEEKVLVQSKSGQITICNRTDPYVIPDTAEENPTADQDREKTDTGINSGEVITAGSTDISEPVQERLSDPADGETSLGEPIDRSEEKYSFPDVPHGYWAYEYIEALADCGVITGFSDGMFAPEAQVSRAQFVAMLARLVNADVMSLSTNKFSDVRSTDWFAPYAAWATNNNVANGTSETTFSPNEPVTREQAATLLYRFAKQMNVEFPVITEGISFKDSNTFSSYAVEAIAAMQRAGILAGVGNGEFDPKGSASRAATAKMLYMVLEYMR